MKATMPCVLVILAATGCTSLGPVQGSTAAGFPSAAPGAPVPSNPFPPQGEDFTPRLIIPATGGPPVIGIPVGGNLFQPVTGGPPVPGIPTGP